MSTRVKSAPCSVCRRVIQVRLDGRIITHGPQSNRCPGSGNWPADLPSTVPSNSSSAQNSNSSVTNHRCPQMEAPPNSSYTTASTAPFVNPGRCIGRILKRIPKASRALAAQKLTSILIAINSKNDAESWERLFLFPRRCLTAPKRGGHRRNLGSAVNQAIQTETDIPEQSISKRRQSHNSTKDLAARVSAKLEDGDFKGAVRLASSAESLCQLDERSLNLLREKHPSAHPDSCFPPAPTSQDPLVFTPREVKQAVLSFPAGSAGGPNGLLPQHLKDLLSPLLGEVSTIFAEALATFVSRVASGCVPHTVTPFFLGPA